MEAALRHAVLDQITLHHLRLIEPFAAHPAAHDHVGEQSLPVKGDGVVEPGA